MSDKNTQYTLPLICGLWGGTVVASEHNNNGECNCIGCPGMHCCDCIEYSRKVREGNTLSFLDKGACHKCLKLLNARGR